MFGSKQNKAEIEALKAQVIVLKHDIAALKTTLEDFRQTLGELEGRDEKHEPLTRSYGPEHEFRFDERR